MKTVVVIGANGQLGSDCLEAFLKAGDEAVGLTHQDVEVSEAGSVEKMMEKYSPSVIINTAAFHNVEKCESEPERAFAVNALGARNLANASRARNTYLVHISTDYVFDGAKKSPYTEEDAPLPLNVYANSKLAGEHFVRAIAPRHAVVRVCGVYGRNPCRAKGGNNFVQTMLKLARERGRVKVVADEVLTPTSSRAISEQLVRLAKDELTGLFHSTCQDSCSWYDFAAAIFEIAKVKVELQAAAPGEFPIKVARPKYSVLDNQRLRALGADVMPHWRDALQTYLREVHNAG